MAPALRDLSAALGLIDEHDSLSGEFFSSPLECVRRALSVESRRVRLVAGIDALLERDAALSRAGSPELRAYPLVDLDEGRVDLGLALDGSAVTLVLLGRVVVDADAGVAVEVEVPLVHAERNTVEAVTGTTAGPILVRAVAEVGGGTLGLHATVHEEGGSFGLSLTGLVIDGTPVPPLEVSSADFTGGVERTLRVVLDLATTVLGAAVGGAAGDVVRHLPGVLGLVEGVPALPLGELAATPGTFRSWLAELARDQAAGLRTWLAHLAGLAGLTPPTGTGRPSTGAPWLVRLLDGPPEVWLEVAIASGADGVDRLEVALRLGLDAPAAIDASASAAVTVVRLPLTGSAAEEWFPALSAQVTLPALGAAGPLVPVSGGFGLGRASAGIRVEGGDVRPSLVLADVTFAGRPYPVMDLSSADALTTAGGQVAGDALDELLGTTGLADDLLVLVGLRAGRPGDPTIDLGRLAADPLRAIGEHHLALLRGPGWDGPLEALAHLFGVTGVAATGADGRTRVTVHAADEVTLALVLDVTDLPGALRWDLGLEVSVMPTDAGGPGLAAGALLTGSARLLACTFADDGAVDVTGLDGLRLTGSLPGVTEGPVRTGPCSVEVAWDAGAQGRVGARVAALAVVDPADPETLVEIGDVALPFDDVADVLGPLAAAAVGLLGRRAPEPWASLARLVGPALAQVGDLDDLVDLPAEVWARVLADPAEALRLAEAVLGDSLRAVEAWGAVAGEGEDEGLALRMPDGWAGRADPLAGDGVPAGDGTDPAADPAEAVAGLLRAAQADPRCAAALAGLDVGAVAEGVLALSLGPADGLWGAGEPTGWTALRGNGPATDPFAGVVEEAVDLVETWLGADGVLVAVAPAWWPADGWRPLLVELDRRAAAAGTTRAWASVDLRRDPTAALGTLTSADAYLVAGVSGLGGALSAVAALTGRRIVLVAVGTALAPALVWAGQVPGTRPAGVLGVAAPFGDDPVAAPTGPPVWADPELASSVRVLAAVLAAGPTTAGGPWARLVGAWREAADGCAEPSVDRPATSDVLSAEVAAGAATLLAGVVAPATAPGGALATVPRAAVLAGPEPADEPPADPDLGDDPAAGAADGLLGALRAAADSIRSRAVGADLGPVDPAGVGGPAAGGSPGLDPAVNLELDGARLGVAASLRLPAATGPVAGRGRLGLWVVGPWDAPGLRLEVRLEVGADGPDGSGWLVGPPSAPVAVRRLEVLVVAEVALTTGGAPAATVGVTLHDARVGGVLVPACRPGTPGFDAALDAALGALAARTDAHARALRALLTALRVSGADGARSAGGLAQLLADPAGTLAGLAPTLLPLLDLVPVTGLAPGAEAWERRVGTEDTAVVVRVERSAGAWRVRLGTAAPVTLAGDARLEARVDVGRAGAAVSAQLSAAGAVLALTAGVLDPAAAVPGTTAVTLTLALASRAPVTLWPAPADAAARAVLRDELVAHLPGVVGAGLVSALLAQVAPQADTRWVGPAVGALVSAVRDPAAWLRDALADPALLGEVLAAVGSLAGLGTPAAGRLTVLPDVLEASVTPADGGAQLSVGTPAAGWVPAAGLHLGLAAGVRLLRPVGAGAGQAVPAGSVTLTVDLPGVAAAAWTSLGIAVDLAGRPDGSVGVRLRLLPAPGDPIELLPTFAGIGQLVGAGAQRLLPAVLDLLRDELPAEVRGPVVDLAVALGVHGAGPGDGFDDGPVPLRALAAQTLVDRAAPLAVAVAGLVDEWFGTDLTVTPTTDGVRVSAPGPAGATLSAELVPAGIGLGVSGVSIGPVRLALSARGQLAGGALVVTGAAQVDVDLTEPLRIVPGPSLRAELTAAGEVRVVLLPLGDAVPAADASVTLAPVPAVALTEAGAVELATRWVVAPGLELLVQLLDTQLDVTLGSPQPGFAAPTLRSLLTGAGLIAAGHVVVPLPQPLEVLTGAVASIASTLSIEVAPGVDLRLVADGQVVGVSVSGTVDLGGDEWRPALLLGADGADGIVLEVMHRAVGGGLGGSGWDLAPAITLDDVGLSLTRTGGLLATSWITIGDVAAWIGTSFRLDPTAGTVSVDPMSAALRLGAIGLPALSGGGGNPVAASLLGDANGGGAPVNPPMNLVIAWTGTDLEIRLEGAGPDQTLWVEVGRTFGPLYIGRVGLRAGEARMRVDGADVEVAILGVLVDGGVAIGPLSLAVRGLGLSIPPVYAHRPELWRLELDGLAVDFRSSSLSISGGLLKAPVLDEHGQPLVVNGEVVLDYRGLLQIQAFGFGATALGAYSQVPRPDGSSYASLFVFVAISAPLGGPPYLFLTGVAIGFGINRGFLPPSSIDRVGSFPLVAAMGGLTVPPEEILDQMGPALPVRDGAYWFAAGVTFTTFEIIRSRALAYLVITPQGFEVGLLGLMAATLPTAESPLVTLELGLRASYSSIDQVLQVQAQLTANSWLFSPDCRLTGGFAFMIWFARPQAVLTMGGYGPRYPVPAHFPSVPPLGFEWRVGDAVVIKGESYFAVTPEALMAGGRLEVSAKGDWGYGSLVLYADILLWFHPPKFELWAGIRITGKAFGFGFELSAEVYLRVPPVYGKVRVNFLWGFEFEFGEVAPPPTFLDLPAFLGQFVDAAGAPYGLRTLVGALASDQESTPDGTPGNPFRVGPEFTIEVTSRLPARSVTCGAFTERAAEPLFAVPMGPTPALDPHLSVRVAAVGAAVPTDGLSVALARTPVASAVWAGGPGSGVVGPPQPGTVTAEDMREVPAGVVLGAPARVTTAPGAVPMATAGILDDTDPWGLPLPATGAPAPVGPTGLVGPPGRPARRARRGTVAVPAPVAGPVPAAWPGGVPAPVTAPAADPGPVPAPVLRWSSAGRVARSTRRRVGVDAAEVQVWDLAHDRPSGVLDVRGSLRVVAVNRVGDIVLDRSPGSAAGDVALDLPDDAAAVVLDGSTGRGAAGDGARGWELGTPLQPVTSSLLLAPGAAVRLPAPLGPERPGVPVAAHRVVRAAPSVGTRAATDPGDVVVVAVDALSASADAADVTLSVADGRVGRWRAVGSAAVGRRHLVAGVLEAGPAFEVTVAVTDAWSQAGVAVLTGTSVAAVADRLAGQPWSSLFDAGAPDAAPASPGAVGPRTRVGRAIRFVPAEVASG